MTTRARLLERSLGLDTRKIIRVALVPQLRSRPILNLDRTAQAGTTPGPCAKTGKLPLDRDESPVDAEGVEGDLSDPDGNPSLNQVDEEAGESAAPLSDVLLTADTTAPNQSVRAAADPDPAKLCLESVGVHTYRWKQERTGSSQMTPIQAIYTTGKFETTYTWEDVKTIEVTAGWDLAYKAIKSKGGFLKAQESGSGSEAVTPKKFLGYVRTGVEYRWQHLYCYAPRETVAGVAQYRPYRVLGGAENYKNSKAKVSCKAGIDSIRVSPGNHVWASKKATTKVSGGLSMLGLGLDASQFNSTTTKKKFTNKGTTTGTLCGNNNVVAKASIVRES